ncbi:MAG: amidase [Bacteroidetes bacterium]|nr:amidase [Bacteroidota bacterium]
MKKLILTLSLSMLTGFVYPQSNDSISIALDLIELSFRTSELDSMRTAVIDQKNNFKKIREISIANNLSYSLVFVPPLNTQIIPDKQIDINWELEPNIKLPINKSDLAFYPVHQLSSLIKNKKITSVELTQFFIDRLRKYGDVLECVITITDSLALAQAKNADDELQKGIYRGPLHGIPYGAKDLLAVAGYKTTWGAMAYKDQQLDYTATVIKKLEKAGAVLVAKLTLGALAWGDVWYGGKTKNPWNLKTGSSGSSAGSTSATVAGLVPFAIGSETWGSIVSPATRCGATGLRPTFGRVSKQGAMALSWSMDKLGPICRNAIDCALVLEAIRGEDGLDFSVRDFPFNYDYSRDIKKLRIGILSDEFKPDMFNYQNDSTIIELLKSKGIDLIKKQLPSDIPVNALSFILRAEAGAAFDELTRSNRDTLLIRQVKNAWPNVFRASRLIPAVEYIQANRLRHQLTIQFNEMMKDIDVLIAPSLSSQLLMTNLTGHPCVVLPDGSYAGDNPGTITLLGNHFDEASILIFARYLQELTPFDKEYPPLFWR